MVSLSDYAREVLRRIDSAEALEVLKRAISIEGHKEHPKKEIETGEFYSSLLEKYGLDVTTQEVTDGRFNVIAYLRGECEEPTLMYNSHMDTVPPYSMIEPFKPIVKDGKIYGRGACDAKASLMAFAVAAKALVEAAPPLKGSLLLVGAMGEESESIGTRFLIEHGPRADMAVVGEPTEMKACVAHKGELNMHVTVRGSLAHSSTPHLGVNAISKMGRVIVRLDDELSRVLSRKKHKLLGGMTHCMSIIKGGIYPALVPDRCELTVNVRLIPNLGREEILSIFRSILEDMVKEDPELKFELNYSHSMPPLEISEDHVLVSALINAIEKVTGQKANTTGAPYHTDGGLLSTEANIPTLVCGPGSIKQAHSAVEYVPIGEYLTACKVFALTALELLL